MQKDAVTAEARATLEKARSKPLSTVPGYVLEHRRGAARAVWMAALLWATESTRFMASVCGPQLSSTSGACRMSPKKGAQGPAAGRMPTKTVEPEGEEDEVR